MKELYIKDLKTGGIQLFEEAYKMFYSVLYNYALTITKEQTMAEDAVSEVFLKIWEGRENIVIQESLKLYLFRSVYNQCLNMLKHVSVQNKYRDFFLHHPPLNEYDSDYPLSGVLENEINDILHKTMEQLPEQCRKVFTMSRIDGMKHEEIAKELGISINTVRTHIHRALEKLRNELKDFLIFLIFF